MKTAALALAATALALFPAAVAYVSPPRQPSRHSRSFPPGLAYAPDPETGGRIAGTTPEGFASPVLIQNHRALLAWKETYGHPNIPLKNEGGSACEVLRRLHNQKKLNGAEVAWLEGIGFRFHSIEDVYRFADFGEMLARLMAYEEARPGNNFQVPKKCPEDPELGAWVTGIRRLGREGVHPDHERRLCDLGFAWVSTRKCGSKFMLKYRELSERAASGEDVLADTKTTDWIRAQQQALRQGKLSQTRVQYMGQLFGDTWTTLGREAGGGSSSGR
ncbi:unnamed protein product [Pseudo-nitzschia multistriata]|uniref:Helicase-associated domain-containing protein n=1 Tax=Pseudo-nitzschia multistriata TaxID=183589 RepID=A0A448ZGY1_9STRA|nr:unnamed protein product [Pseudo-nitzschia multistriata]VEU41294.1 unnamed protein product [Pseudo-nitzschia multistriata]